MSNRFMASTRVDLTDVLWVTPWPDPSSWCVIDPSSEADWRADVIASAHSFFDETELVILGCGQ